MAVAAKIGKHLFKYRKNGPVNDALTGRTIGSDFDIGCTLRCFKSVFFGEALQRSEIYLWKVSRWPSRVAGHPIPEIDSAAIESDETTSAADCATDL